MTLLTITPPGGTPSDYSSLVQALNVKWPATTELPTCSVVCNNQGGDFAAVPLFSTLGVSIPGMGAANFRLEKMSFGFTAPSGGGTNTGRTVVLTGTVAPELIFLTEGNLDVVGTDLPVGEFNTRGADYVPYQSTNIMSASLLDIGDLLTALLHTPQPNQAIGYRGRLGYDCTGAGINATWGVDYLGGPIGFYIKGMWQVGLGSTGAQKAGLDLIRDVVTKNVIDGTGAPAVLDFYVDPFASVPTLNIFERGSKNSNQTFTVGTDPVQELSLPIDTQDVKNFVIYWTNAERQYPNGGDAWSNYETGTDMNAAWDWQTQSGSGTWSVSSDTATTTNGDAAGQPVLHVASTSGYIAGTPVIIDQGGADQEVAIITSIQAGVSLTMTQNLTKNHLSGEPVAEHVTRYNGGTSIRLANASGTTWHVLSSGFNLPSNGYRILNAQAQIITALNFSILRTNNYGADELNVYLWDSQGNSVYYPLSTSGGGWPFSQQTLGSTGAWQDVSLPIPQTGYLPWYVGTGSFNFATSNIVKVSFEPYIGGAGSWFLDQIYFADDWQFSPVYSYNPNSAIATTLTSGASAGDTALTVLSAGSFLPGQTVVIDYGNANQENNLITAVAASTQTLTLSTPLLSTHGAVYAYTTTGGSLYCAQPGYPTVTVNAPAAGWSVLTTGSTIQVGGETMTLLKVTTGTPGTLTMTTNFVDYHYVGEPVTQYPATIIGGTHDPNSINAYDYRIFNFVDFYNTSGASDSASIIVSNILNSRKGKKSSGTIKVDGRTAQVSSILPGYRFRIVDAADVYRGGTVDSTIDSWIADVVEYNWSPTSSEGLTVSYTIEPYYDLGNMAPGSPDTNSRNLWRSRTLSEQLRRPLGGEVSLVGRTGITNHVVRDASGNIIGYVTDK